MTYSLKIKASAAKDLARIERQHRLRLIEAIDALKANPHRGANLKGDLSGLRRLRVGDYRILYEIQAANLIVLIVRVAHRRDVYQSR